jgi:hypothetical protein
VACTGIMEVYIQIYAENFKERVSLKDLSVDEMMPLKQIFKCGITWKTHAEVR